MINLMGILQCDEESPSGLSWVADRPNGGPSAGEFAGCLSPAGYWYVWVSGKTYLAHRIIMQLLGNHATIFEAACARKSAELIYHKI